MPVGDAEAKPRKRYICAVLLPVALLVGCAAASNGYAEQAHQSDEGTFMRQRVQSVVGRGVVAINGKYYDCTMLQARQQELRTDEIRELELLVYQAFQTRIDNVSKFTGWYSDFWN